MFVKEKKRVIEYFPAKKLMNVLGPNMPDWRAFLCQTDREFLIRPLRLIAASSTLSALGLQHFLTNRNLYLPLKHRPYIYPLPTDSILIATPNQITKFECIQCII
jgi:hypothetical protein